MANVACRGVVLLVFDTLRADFLELCAREGRRLPAFERIFGWTCPLKHFVSGSFPTVPMRTDLLTGRLTFLERRWSPPAAGEAVLTAALREAGVPSFLVTDNYVISVPSLRADLRPLFDESTVMRGRGSDPYAPIDERLALPLQGRPTRSRSFDEQYLANLKADEHAPGTPSQRFFGMATEALETARKRDRFFLWVDCFAAHEPWAGLEAIRSGMAEDEPLWTPYGAASQLTSYQLTGLKSRYCERIAEIDQAMERFADALERVLAPGDVALAIASDHGFYFGEFGLLGKPKPDPVLPPLFELLGRVSSHIERFLPAASFLQPHDWTAALARVLGAAWPSDSDAVAPLRVVGRNTPESKTLTLLSASGVAVVGRNAFGERPQWTAWSDLRGDSGWSAQARPLPDPRFCDAAGRFPWMDSPWAREFSEQLALATQR